mmetsp:Transcript_6506/g.18162  ORF Transcript_6506/g.18162 Transcript_6506/m.18162 type:complete len:765 (+) Transcript_6506:79-2373(+)
MATSPSLRWSFDLPNVSGRISSSALLRKGNAVVPTRDGHLYITTDDGTLNIVAMKNGAGHGTLLADGVWQDETGLGGVADTISFQPLTVEGRHSDCRSGVSLHQTDDGVKFAVYAVSDVPIVQSRTVTYDDKTAEMTFVAPGIEDEDVKSRVVAVNADGTLRWEVTLAGYVEGTPLIGQADPTKVFVSLNVPDVTVQNVYDPDFYRGRVVVINEAGVEDGGVEVTASKESQPVPFGPLALRAVEVRGEPRDIVFVTENRGIGHVPAGGIYVLTPTEEYDLRLGRGNGAYELRTLSRWLRSSIAPCVVSDSNGNSLWASGTGSRLAGFDLGSFVTSVGEKEMIGATWETTISASIRNDTQPLRAAGALSDDGASIFVAGGSTTFNSINAMTGQVQWADNNGESLYISQPKISKITQNIVYAIEHASGKVVAYNSATGTRQWEFDCRDSTGIDSCQESVEAEFAISPNGNLLIYGDIFGRIHALQIASHSMSTPPFVMPTREPNIPVPTRHPRPAVSPTTPLPDYTRPSLSPTLGAVEDSPGQPQSAIQNINTTNTAGIAAGVIIGVVVLGVGLFWFVSRRRRNKKSSEKKAADDIDAQPPFEEIKDDTCYLRRGSKGDGSVEWMSSRASNASFTGSHYGNDSDVEASERSVGGDRRSQVLAEIFQQNIAQREEAVASLPPPATASDTTDGEAIEMIRSATSELSSRISSGLQTMTKTLSETNLASLESSVIPFLSLGGGCAVDIDELSDTEKTGQEKEGDFGLNS